MCRFLCFPLCVVLSRQPGHDLLTQLLTVFRSVDNWKNTLVYLFVVIRLLLLIPLAIPQLLITANVVIKNRSRDFLF